MARRKMTVAISRVDAGEQLYEVRLESDDTVTVLSTEETCEQALGHAILEVHRRYPKWLVDIKSIVKHIEVFDEGEEELEQVTALIMVLELINPLAYGR